MTALDRLIPLPRLLEIEHVDLAASPGRVWEVLRHGNLARSPLVRALFAIRTLPGRVAGRDLEPLGLCLDDVTSTPARPGFQILVDDPPREVAVGAIGKVWKVDIPFRHVEDATAFGAFAEPGWVKVAWALRAVPRGAGDTRVEVEVRVDATDEDSWHEFRTYWRLIGPGSHLIRRSLLGSLARELGVPDAHENDRPLPGDDLLPDAAAQLTHGVTLAASPDEIWPWLVQMGAGRAGFYSIDALDNGGRRSAREIHPDLQTLAVGDQIPATPDGDGSFEVLRVDAPHVLALGGLFDAGGERPLRFGDPRPARYWHVTWTFVLEPLDAGTTTRLHVRARVAFSPDERLHATWIGPVHHLMQTAQLRHLAARVEQRLARDDWRDVVEGVSGAALMALMLLTPFWRARRTTWGIDAADAEQRFPGDELAPDPTWMWTHAVDIDAPADEVWPWVAQVGADRGGFYSYQWLENLVGCEVRNAESIHPEWQVRQGDGLRLHPRMPPLDVVRVEPGRYFVASGASDPSARVAGRPWMACTWLFLVEPLGAERCRFVSRYRVACSDDVSTRLQFGPATTEPIGFVMDRRMLLGVKERAERGRNQLRRRTP